MAIQKIQLRRDTSLRWTAVNPVLSSGEGGYETDTKRIKYGDGVTSWSLLPYKLESGAQGPLGPTGPAGAAGPQGVAGPLGLEGPIGAAGPVNTLAIGTVTYNPIALTATATITGTAPSQTLNLTLPKGDSGSAGAPCSLTIGTVSPGTAAATISGTAPNQTLNLTLPSGATGAASTVPGPTGPTGPTGATGEAGPTGSVGAGIAVKGSITAWPPGSPTAGDMWLVVASSSTVTAFAVAFPTAVAGDGIVYASSAWENAGQIRGPRGPTGVTGATGADGATGGVGPSVSLTMGTVTSPTTATASIGGTTPNYSLNLGLPIGATGPQGVQGERGITGATGSAGPANVLSIGTVAATTSSPTVTITGNAPTQTLSFTLKTGAAGPTAVSANTGNAAKLGTDSLLFVPKLNESFEVVHCPNEGGVYLTTTTDIGKILVLEPVPGSPWNGVTTTNVFLSVATDLAAPEGAIITIVRECNSQVLIGVNSSSGGGTPINFTMNDAGLYLRTKYSTARLTKTFRQAVVGVLPKSRWVLSGDVDVDSYNAVSIPTQPSDASTVVGDTATFSVVATVAPTAWGLTPTLVYTWYSMAYGATTGTLVAAGNGFRILSVAVPVALANPVGYYCVISTDSSGSRTSTTALLTTRTSNGSQWATQAIPVGSIYAGVAFNNTFVYIGSSNSASSTDGRNWTTSSAFSTLTKLHAAGLIACSSSTILAIDVNGYPRASGNGVTWGQIGAVVVVPSGTPSGKCAMAYGDGKFVAVQRANVAPVIKYSADGQTWTTITSPTSASGAWATYDPSSLAYGQTTGSPPAKQWVLVGSANGVNTNVIFTSTDLQTWTAVTLPTVSSWTHAALLGNQFRVTGPGLAGYCNLPNGTTAWSTSWIQVTMSHIGQWSSMAYGNGTFVAVTTGPVNTCGTSTDGTTWITREMPTSQSWIAVLYAGGRFVAGGTQTGNLPTSSAIS